MNRFQFLKQCQEKLCYEREIVRLEITKLHQSFPFHRGLDTKVMTFSKAIKKKIMTRVGEKASSSARSFGRQAGIERCQSAIAQINVR